MSESSGEATPKEGGPEVSRGANRYQLLVENSHDMMAEFTLDGTYVYANRAHEAILGYGVEELIGVNAFSLVHPEDQEKAARYIQEEQHRGTIRYRHQDGSWRWLDCTGSIYPINGVPRMVISGRDITHQMQTQNRLAVLAGLARVLGAVNDFAEAARVVARAVGELCGWDAFSLDMYSAEENRVHPVLTIDTVNGHQMDVPHGYDGTEPSALFQRVLNEGPLLILRTEARFDGEGVPFGKEKRPSRSLLFVPLIEQGRTIGIASAQSYRANAYTEEDLKLLESLADHCAATFARLAAVEASREAQSWFQGFMEINPAAVSIKDQEGRFVYVNRTVEQATNTTSKDWVGKTDSEMLSAEMARMFREQDQLIFEKGVSRDFHVDLPMSNGEVHRWQIWKFPLESRAGGRYLGAMAFDINEQEQAREALRQSEEKFRSVFHQAPVGISISLKGVFSYVNQAFLDLFGCKDDSEVLGKHVVEFVAPGVRAEMVKRIQNREGGAVVPESYETTGLRSDGAEFPLQVNVTRVRLPDGMNTVGFMMDLTQRRTLEAQLLHSQKLESVGRLAGGVAHDFNNLLTVVKGYASILEDSGLTSDQHEAVEQISTAAGKAAALTSQLLAFSRKQVVQLRTVNLNQVVQHMTRMLARVLGSDVALELDLDSCLPQVRADAGMLDQVILNLAVNARDAMPQGGTLRIVTRCADLTTDPEACREIGQPKAVCLEVSDTGCGISEENLPKIFEPFFTTKEVGAGTGLGLPTVYGIVKQHGGAINVCSRVGEGARFRICIPSLEPEPEAEPCPVKTTDPVGGNGETILVVEDDTAIRNLVRLGLKRSGYQVIEAADATEGLARFKEAGSRISVVLTDIVMPGAISGTELAGQIRAIAPDTRIVFTSGYAPGTGKTGFALGPTETFLAKPYKLQELFDVIRKKIESGN